MKVGEIRNALELLAAALEAPEQSAIKSFCAVFPAADMRSLPQFLKIAEPTPIVSHDRTSKSISDVHDSLQRFIPFARSYAKPALVKDLGALVDMLSRHRSASVPDFVEAARQRLANASLRKAPATGVRDDVVAAYVKELEDTYKDKSSFISVFDRLRADKNVRKQEAAAIASHFVHETAVTTARPEALRRILQKHEFYISSAAKARAMSGRSAA